MPNQHLLPPQCSQSTITRTRQTHHRPGRKTATNNVVTGLMTDFTVHLKDNFSARFGNFSIPRDIIGLVCDLLELVDLQASSLLKTELINKENLESFWSAYICPENYVTMKKLALFVLSLFGSTYTCKAAYSTINAIKQMHKTG
ncbi:UNVERIFIED_CONTAM: hypothetical protein FKN15_022385 [Acipenser sinensis]